MFLLLLLIGFAHAETSEFRKANPDVCNALLTTWVPAVRAKASDALETKLWYAAQSVSIDMDAVIEGGVLNLDCMHAKALVAGPSALEFMATFREIMVEKTAATMTDMTRVLTPMVDEQVGKVLEDTVADIEKLTSQFPAVAADYAAVEEGPDCIKRFHSFVSEVQAVGGDGIPNWDSVLTAVETLLAKCTTKEEENAEL